ncbi:NAD(P)/FAD-dependent oxidoreductase [Deinococcus maricopensis]|uniref:Ferredoxin--NADP reductase n=1 Tax=Deinococcus maricopensis (strain DSM 21211 / LMG 22137 / NRRL B-23946 / LB-34) TaxID=709986 RepID=E8UAF2_DEIML|nr:NAD(P)/FAD-dependent oxidoreductase [Deinococcus maricopensis]ADV68041.1 Ferredoxin--NADP reductase [Deinococcus maricopensis DSM 21211]
MVTDVLVIGAGPVGLYAAFYVAWRGLRVVIADARPEPGGQLAALYPDKVMYDVPGFVEVRAGALVQHLVRQLDLPGVTWRLGETVQGLAPEEEGWVAALPGGAVRAGAVILAGGLGALQPRAASVPGAGSLPTFTDVMDARTLAPRRALVWGGVPQATRMAVDLADAGAHVTLAHRRALFRGSPEDLARLDALRAKGTLEVRAPADLQSLRAEEAVLDDVAVPVDVAFVLNGYLPDLAPLQGVRGLTWDGEYVVADEVGRTTLPGVFVAGDLSSSGGSFKLLSRGFSDAALTANHAAHHVNPDLKVRPGHSSDKRRPAR